jgi:hypothetical protein
VRVNVDAILTSLNGHRVEYLLIGGMNFLLRHKPVLTFDVDVWIHDTADNRRRCEEALAVMDAQWGPTQAEWGPVTALRKDWLSRQSVFCLTTPHGAVDVFRVLPGVPSWAEASTASVECRTAGGASCRGLCDADMLRCQEALDESERKPDRVAYLRHLLSGERRP